MPYGKRVCGQFQSCIRMLTDVLPSTALTFANVLCTQKEASLAPSRQQMGIVMVTKLRLVIFSTRFTTTVRHKIKVQCFLSGKTEYVYFCVMTLSWLKEVIVIDERGATDKQGVEFMALALILMTYCSRVLGLMACFNESFRVFCGRGGNLSCCRLWQ